MRYLGSPYLAVRSWLARYLHGVSGPVPDVAGQVGISFAALTSVGLTFSAPSTVSLGFATPATVGVGETEG